MAVALCVLSLVGCGDDDGESAPTDVAVTADTPDDADTGDLAASTNIPPDARDDIEPIPGWFADGTLDEAFASAWLRAGGYRGWSSSSGVHPSTMPEGGSRVYLNAALVDSLTGGATSHPVGSMAVREIYGLDLRTLLVVNLLVKRESGAGAEWVFMEMTDLEPGGQNPTPLVDPPPCMACHFSPSDRVISTWPLP